MVVSMDRMPWMVPSDTVVLRLKVLMVSAWAERLRAAIRASTETSLRKVSSRDLADIERVRFRVVNLKRFAGSMEGVLDAAVGGIPSPGGRVVTAIVACVAVGDLHRHAKKVAPRACGGRLNMRMFLAAAFGVNRRRGAGSEALGKRQV